MTSFFEFYRKWWRRLIESCSQIIPKVIGLYESNKYYICNKQMKGTIYSRVTYLNFLKHFVINHIHKSRWCWKCDHHCHLSQINIFVPLWEVTLDIVTYNYNYPQMLKTRNVHVLCGPCYARDFFLLFFKECQQHTFSNSLFMIGGIYVDHISRGVTHSHSTIPLIGLSLVELLCGSANWDNLSWLIL